MLAAARVRLGITATEVNRAVSVLLISRRALLRCADRCLIVTC